jgi:hypothetical protein
MSGIRNVDAPACVTMLMMSVTQASRAPRNARSTGVSSGFDA